MEYHNSNQVSTDSLGIVANKKILIVEDDDSIRYVLTEILHQNGYAVKSCINTLDITAEVDDFNPDLVLLDYLLPGINGGELCGQLKRNILYQNIPVVLLSAYDKVFLSIGSYGCDLFISKPFDMHYLLSCVEGFIKNG